MDGNFGLKRTARGQHSSITADSTIMTKFFVADLKVEQYADNIALSVSNRTQETNDNDNDEERRVECSALKKADPKRTATANAKFHETGVFGSLCARHGVPLSFVNIVKSGEKYKYPLAVVHKIFDQLGTKNVDIMYDIGCQFEASLKVRNNVLVRRCAVGIFHAYAHKPSCQVEYNPKYISGFGMTDGEWSERLWSYMNGYIPTTRHMSSEHRILTLTIALDYFKRKRINSIGQTLVNRYKSAEKKQASTKKYMEDNHLSYAALQRKWEFHKHEILHGSLDPRMAEDTEKEEIIQRLHAACTEALSKSVGNFYVGVY
ncbi:hypothetical protein BJV82DRAFT_613516 [Fennellomyces sp. T-0311]|nr:hypothetical protein BJV82DRAFT_613516 [Fennellomyces sp. T-0311]